MILRKNSELIQNKNQYKYFQELKVQTDNPESIIITDSLGKVCFLGNAGKKRKINWVNFFTRKEANNSLYVDYKYVRSEDDVEFNGIFADTQTLGEDQTVIFDFSKCAQLSDEYTYIVFQIAQSSMLDNIKKNMYNGVMSNNYDSFGAFSRFRVDLNNSNIILYAEKFKKALSAEKVITKSFPKKDHCIVYSGLNHKVVADGNVISLEAENLTDRLDILAITCRALQDTDAVVELNDCVTVAGSKGYLYLEPFSVSDTDIKDAEIEIVANRQLPLEIFDEDQNIWLAFEPGILGRLCFRDIRMRIGAETGDYVRNIYIKK